MVVTVSLLLTFVVNILVTFVLVTLVIVILAVKQVTEGKGKEAAYSTVGQTL